MIGSERLSQLLEAAAGDAIGEEFAEALRLARDELGAERVRAHAIFHDDLGGGTARTAPSTTSRRVDRVYDRRPRARAAPGRRAVVHAARPRGRPGRDRVRVRRGIISPPRGLGRWGELVGALAAHLVERYGIDEVARWGFEVWNEANLEVFWTGTQDEYFRLYELAVRAVKAVDERLPVGGPSTAAAGWVADFLDFVVDAGAPLDFLSTHTYGNLPLDVRRGAATCAASTASRCGGRSGA